MTLWDSTGNENRVGHPLAWKPQRLCPFGRPAPGNLKFTRQQRDSNENVGASKQSFDMTK